jgi:hypothetical protein
MVFSPPQPKVGWLVYGRSRKPPNKKLLNVLSILWTIVWRIWIQPPHCVLAVSAVMVSMPDESRRKTYTDELRIQPWWKDEMASEGTESEVLESIRTSLLALTSGCTACKYHVGGLCQIDRHPVKEGDVRCERFIRIHSGDPEEASRTQFQDFVNDILGIRGKTRTRLTGHN